MTLTEASKASQKWYRLKPQLKIEDLMKNFPDTTNRYDHNEYYSEQPPNKKRPSRYAHFRPFTLLDTTIMLLFLTGRNGNHEPAKLNNKKKPPERIVPRADKEFENQKPVEIVPVMLKRGST
ncbi:hypothetical protein [Gluconobacter sp. GP1]|uniref:hypothetical protein n=1 Tax=Gluconobacter sp. GP1 TaxID=3046423 RepID=UPI00293E2D7C|nr:hypothetical protein [Gluconobacter sp. GP1]